MAMVTHPGRPPVHPHRPRRLRGNQNPMGTHRPVGLVAPASNLHVEFPNFTAKTNADAECHLLCSNDWINSQGIVGEGKCSRFCSTLASYAYLGYESFNPVGNDWNNL